jgi:diguanylate cyclase (GGDEF)-like protein/PAS domain S-box-containing protein
MERDTSKISVPTPTTIILLVDDEQNIIKAVQRTLVDEPYRILTAASGAEAIKILEAESVDVLLTDLMMPGISGIELIKRGRQLRPFSLQTIILTGYGSMETAITAMRAGASDYLLKPFENSALIKAVAAAAQRAQEAKAAQQVISDIREKSLSIFEIVQAGIMLVDEISNEIVDINPAACAMVGAKAEDLIGKICHQTVCASGFESCPLTNECNGVKNVSHMLMTRSGKQCPIIKSVCKINSANRSLRLATFMDMSESVKLESELTASQETFYSIVEKSLDGIFIIDNQGTTRFSNQAGCQLFGRSMDKMIGQPLGCPIAPFETTEIDIINHKTGTITAEMRVTDSEWHGEQAYVVTLRDISERKMEEDYIKSLANHDHLTGLPNRRLLLDRLDIAISRAKRNAGQIAIFFLDLDGFKQINDTFGHDSGDEVLKVISSRLSKMVRSSDTISRVGGDEFILVMGEISIQEDIFKVTRKMVALVNEPITSADHEHRVGCSIGISLYPKDGSTPFELIKRADAAMYQVKESGKNSYAFFTQDV